MISAEQPVADLGHIDQLTDTAVMALRRAMQAVSFDDLYGYGVPLAVLIDPGLHDPLANHDYTQQVPRIPLDISTIDRSLSPYLVTLGGAVLNERALNASLRVAVQECLGAYDTEIGRPRSVCAWLVHAQPQEANWHQVCAALNKRAWVKPPTDEPRKVVRFWDPRITTQLPATFGGETWHECLQALGLQQWWTLTGDATLARVGEPQGKTPHQAHWQLDTAQWHGLRMLAWSNVIAQAATAWDIPQPPKATALDDIARRAVEHGMRDNSDMLAFAHLALTVHPMFDRHSHVMRALKDWQRDGRVVRGFAKRTEDWGEDFLAQLQTGAWLNDGLPQAHSAASKPSL